MRFNFILLVAIGVVLVVTSLMSLFAIIRNLSLEHGSVRSSIKHIPPMVNVGVLALIFTGLSMICVGVVSHIKNADPAWNPDVQVLSYQIRGYTTPDKMAGGKDLYLDGFGENELVRNTILRAPSRDPSERSDERTDSPEFLSKVYRGPVSARDFVKLLNSAKLTSDDEADKYMLIRTIGVMGKIKFWASNKVYVVGFDAISNVSNGKCDFDIDCFKLDSRTPLSLRPLANAFVDLDFNNLTDNTSFTYYGEDDEEFMDADAVRRPQEPNLTYTLDATPPPIGE